MSMSYRSTGTFLMAYLLLRLEYRNWRHEGLVIPADGNSRSWIDYRKQASREESAGSIINRLEPSARLNISNAFVVPRTAEHG
jgi:hypothetical protein